MKKLQLLALSLLFLSYSCSKDDTEGPSSGKAKFRFELDFTGAYQEYKVHIGLGGSKNKENESLANIKNLKTNESSSEIKMTAIENNYVFEFENEVTVFVLDVETTFDDVENDGSLNLRIYKNDKLYHDDIMIFSSEPTVENPNFWSIIYTDGYLIRVPPKS